MRSLSILALAIAAFAAAACSGGRSQPNAKHVATRAVSSPPASPSPRSLLDELRDVVPSNWALQDWQSSPDGQYVVLTESANVISAAARPALGKPPTSLNVYRRTAGGSLVEAARFIGYIYKPGEPTFTRDPQLLAPDAAGVRRLNIHWLDASGAANGVSPAVDTHLVISADGSVSFDHPPDPGIPATPEPTLSGSPPVDPVRLVTRTMDPEPYGTPTPQPPVSLPAGAWPAGWRFLQAVASPDGRMFAVVTEAPADGLLHQLSVYQIAGGALVERWRVVNAFVSVDPALSFHDINGDGLPELVYRSDDAGNGWTWHGTFDARINADSSVDGLVFNLPTPKSAPTKPVDLNGDGIYEWMAIDARWELKVFCHACSPASEFVLAWDGREYIDASARFGAAIVGARPDPAPPPAGAQCRDQESYLSALVGRFLDYSNAGRAGDAARIRATLQAYPVDQQLVAERDAVAASLASGPDAPVGDTPPTSCF